MYHRTLPAHSFSPPPCLLANLLDAPPITHPGQPPGATADQRRSAPTGGAHRDGRSWSAILATARQQHKQRLRHRHLHRAAVQHACGHQRPGTCNTTLHTISSLCPCTLTPYPRMFFRCIPNSVGISHPTVMEVVFWCADGVVSPVLQAPVGSPIITSAVFGNAVISGVPNQLPDRRGVLAGALVITTLTVFDGR